MALYKPVLSYKPVQGDYKQEGVPEITLKYLTPHHKWSTHSMYFDSQQMLTLFRGGQTIWLNEDDAAEIDVKDNDWVEAFNKNGIVAARAVVSPRYYLAAFPICTIPKIVTSTFLARKLRNNAVVRIMHQLIFT